MAYLYAWAGAPWKTQQRVRQILDTMYADTPDGLIGNEDCGQMSAWYVLSALGLYPVDPAGAYYVDRLAALREGDRRARGRPAPGGAGGERVGREQVRPVGDARREAATRAWLRHDELLAAGEIAFVMGPQPNREWGASEADRPPSMSDPRD